MADWWIDDSAASNGTDTGGQAIGSAWNNPAKYLWASDGSNVGLMARATGPRPAAGDRVFVLGGHLELQGAAVNMTNDGTVTNPVIVISVASFNSGSPNALDNTSLIGTTGSFAVAASAGGLMLFGFILNPTNNGAVSIAGNFLCSPNGDMLFALEDGAIRLGSTSSQPRIVVGANGGTTNLTQTVRLRNVTAKFANASQSIQFRRGQFEWLGGGIDAAGSIPTALFTSASGGMPSRILCEDLDLSGLSTSIFDVSTGSGVARLSRCKLHGSVALTTGSHAGAGGVEAEMVDCDSADTNIRYSRVNGFGSVNSSAAVYLTGGAKSKRNGSDVPFSHFLTGTHACGKFLPLYSPWYPMFLDSVGSKTFSIKVAYDRATALTNEELFIEIEVLGTSGSVQGSLLTSRLSAWQLQSGSALSNTSESWAGSGGWTNKKTHTLSVPATIAEQGIARVRIGCTAQSVPIYVDPLPVAA